MNVRIIKKRILDILFPQHLKCHSCGREAAVNGYGICADCEAKLLFAANAGNIEGVDGFTAGLQYNDVARRALRSFKYHGALYKKEFLTHHIHIPEDWEIDCIVPVPLHIDRLKRRGYNQSKVLADELVKRYDIPVREDLLSRIRNTPMQARMNRQQRMKNVKNAFSASPECKGLSIALLDDMRTTGSTLKECALELKKHGAAKVYAITACCSMEEVINSERNNL